VIQAVTAAGTVSETDEVSRVEFILDVGLVSATAIVEDIPAVVKEEHITDATGVTVLEVASSVIRQFFRCNSIPAAGNFTENVVVLSLTGRVLMLF
jgi:hypothetical protein